MHFLLQAPIVFEVANERAVTPEITYPQVILSAVAVAGIIMALAGLAGLMVGAVIIYFKRRAEAATPTTETQHVRLRLG